MAKNPPCTRRLSTSLGFFLLAERRRLPVSGVRFAEGCRCRIGEKGLLGVGSAVLEYGLLLTARCSGGAETWEKGGIIKGIKRKLLEVKRVRY